MTSHASVRRRTSAVSVAGLVLALVAACSAGPLEEHRASYQDIRPVAEVLVIADRGSVSVSAWTGPTINVTRTLRYRGATPPATTATLVSGSILRIEYDCSGIADCAVDTEVQVPAQKTVTVRTATGSITLTGLRGRLSATTSSGSILGRGLAVDQADISTDSGSVDLEYAEPPTAVSLRSGSGAISVRLPDGAYHVTATSGSGAVLVDIPSDPAAGRSIEATSGSGTIAIHR